MLHPSMQIESFTEIKASSQSPFIDVKEAPDPCPENGDHPGRQRVARAAWWTGLEPSVNHPAPG